MILHQEITTGSYRFNDIHCKIFIIHMHTLHDLANHFKYVIVDDQLLRDDVVAIDAASG